MLAVALGLASAADNPQTAALPIQAPTAPPDLRRALDVGVVRVLGPAAIPLSRLRRRLMGDDLDARTAACGGDVAGLADLGRRVGADRVLFGRLARDRGGDWWLRLAAVDTQTSALSRVATWRLPSGAGTEVAARQAAWVAAPASARLRVELVPPDAEVLIHGEPTGWKHGAVVSIPPGLHPFEVRAPGHAQATLTVEATAGETSRLRAVLDLDPLYVPAAGPRLPEVFSTDPPNIAPGRTLPKTLVEAEPGPARSPWPRVLRWAGVALSAGAAATGVALMVDAQSGYDAQAGDVRFDASTTSAREAVTARDTADDQMIAGNVLLWSGLGLAVAGTVWALVANPDG